ncbi:MAG: redoxin domain-containing protein [Planctomycetes bacterium]|nr:redoxin domain-containing protein [Planctomycetota bacterium]
MLKRFRFAAVVVVVVGAAGLLSAADAPKVGGEAKDFELTALGGEKVKLSKAVESGPVVLVVLRGYPGYQCPICTKQVAEFLGKADEFKRAGAHVVFVYPGPADKLKEYAAEFVKGKDYPAHFTVLLDPDYALTNAYGLRWDAKNETAYPSTFVIDGKRKVTFAKVSTTHGDRAKVGDVLKAIPAK